MEDHKQFIIFTRETNENCFSQRESAVVKVSVHLFTHSLNQSEIKMKKKQTKELLKSQKRKQKQAHRKYFSLTKSMTVQTYIHVSNNLQTLVYT